MSKRRFWFLLAALSVIAGILPPSSSLADQIQVHYKEGLLHGFLVLRTLEGEIIADGDWIQTSHADHLTNRLIFHFKDGSLHDETAVFSQGSNFKLLRAHLIQKGPSFPHPLDVTTDVTHGTVTVRYTDDGGNERVIMDHPRLPTDVSNGMILTLMKNIPHDAAKTTVSMVVATPKPRIVKLVIVPDGEDTFSTGTVSRKAIHYVVKVQIGGIAGLAAPLLGKQPPDTHVWIFGGDAPTFVKSEGPLFFGGPVWRIELVSPLWH